MARGRSYGRSYPNVNQMMLDNGLRLPKTGERFYGIKHCDGLYLRISATGAASCPVMFDVKGERGEKRKQVKKTLGILAEVRNGVLFVRTPLEELVRRAEALKAAGRVGRNPVADERSAAVRAAANTVRVTVERWLDACETGVGVRKKLRPKTISGYRQIMTCDVVPRWGDMPLSSITEDHVKALWHDKATRRLRPRNGATGGAVVQANRAITRLHTFFDWCVRQKLLGSNPAAGLIKTSEESRDRVLSDDEIVSLWRATDGWDGRNRRDGIAYGPLFRVLLLAAQRENEVGGMRWKELDLDSGQWQIPSSRAKNGKPHLVRLNRLAVAELKQLPRRGELVFGKPSFSRAKARLDKAMGAKEPWIVHDLRRTAATGMARLKIQPHVVDKILNHSAGTIRGVARIYNRFQYADERAEALDAWGDFVEGLVTGKVTSLQKIA